MSDRTVIANAQNVLIDFGKQRARTSTGPTPLQRSQLAISSVYYLSGRLQAAAIDRLTDHLARIGECPPDRDGCETCPVYLDTGDPDDDLVTLAKCWREWARR